MELTFEPITTLTNRAPAQKVAFAANEAFRSNNASQEQASISDTIGYHIYGDLHLTLELCAATEQDKANLFLEVLEDLAAIVSEFARANPNVLIFEMQGERIHLFLNRPAVDESTLDELITFCSYLTDAVYERIRPKVEPYWVGFCMAADFGRAVAISTGRNGDSSLISLGNAANRPAKRLARDPQVQSGHLALLKAIAEQSDEIRNVEGRYAVGEWIELHVRERPRHVIKTANEVLLETALANSAAVNARAGDERPTVAFAAKSAEVVPTAGATVERPTMVQGVVFRADLDNFTPRVEAAFAVNDINAVKKLVLEFLQIMKLADAFEEFLGRPLIRLPWAGDCYTAILLPKTYEDYPAVCRYLAATASLHWHDPDGAVNSTRDEASQRLALSHKWSVGAAGGVESNGRVLVANLHTWHRQFLVAAGWSARRSLDAQNAKGLRSGESAIHDEDYPKMDECYKEAYFKWETGPVAYRKATAAGLKRAEEKKIEHRVSITGPANAPTPRPIPIPVARPHYDDRNPTEA